MKPLISVIIPVYNVEQYIVECLESVRVQTFRDYEVIIVNDGTKDRSAELTEQFIRNHCLANWSVLHKENGGVTSARNAGLDAAQGNWILFMDSDDWLESNALEVLAEHTKNPVDLVIGGYQAYDQTAGTTEVWSDYPCDFGVMPENLGKLHSFSVCWGRLYKKAIIDQNHLRFDERIRYGEDHAWQFDYQKNIDSFAYAHEILYNYRIFRDGSMTTKLVTPQMQFYIGEHMYRFFDGIDQDQIWRSLLNNPRLLSATWSVLSSNIVNDILNQEYSTAREKMKSSLGKSVEHAFAPRNKKEQLFMWMWRHSFVMLCAFVKVYYGNFETLRRSKLVQVLSKRK